MGGPYNRAMTVLRPLLSLMLALALTAGSVALAMARSQPGTGQWMEICAGTEVLAVEIDTQGKPVSPRHPCPDCLTGLTGFLPGAAPQTVPPLTAGRVHDVAFPTAAPSRPDRAAVARGPPL